MLNLFYKKGKGGEMMKSKGFTLIELLAVIVILAIIALIATPIVLGIIEDSKQNTNRVSAQYIVDAVENAYSMAYTQNQGAIPTLDQVAAAFKMKGASWDTTKGEIVADSGVIVEVIYANGILQVTADDYDIASESMEISASTVEAQS